MKLNQLKFRQAAKRYATAKKLPLATAQEEFATFFGFRNLDAALKALAAESSVEHPPNGPTKGPAKPGASVLWCGLSFNEFRLLAHFLEKKALAENKLSDTGSWIQKSKELFDAVTLALPLTVDTNQSPGTLKKAFTIERIEHLYIEACRGMVDGVWPLSTAKLARVLEGMPGYDTKRLIDALGQRENRNEELAYRCLYVEKVYLDPLQAIEMAGGAERIKLCTDRRSDLSYLLSDFLKEIAGQKRMPTGTEYESFNTSMTIGDQASIYGTPPEADTTVAIDNIDGYIFKALRALFTFPEGKWCIKSADPLDGPCCHGATGYFVKWPAGARDVLEELASEQYIRVPQSEDALTEMMGRANFITAASNGSWVHTLRFTETSPGIAVVRLRDPAVFMRSDTRPIQLDSSRWRVDAGPQNPQQAVADR